MGGFDVRKLYSSIAVNVHLHHQVEELVLSGVLAHGPHHLQQLI